LSQRLERFQAAESAALSDPPDRTARAAEHIGRQN